MEGPVPHQHLLLTLEHEANARLDRADDRTGLPRKAHGQPWNRGIEPVLLGIAQHPLAHLIK